MSEFKEYYLYVNKHVAIPENFFSKQKRFSLLQFLTSKIKEINID